VESASSEMAAIVNIFADVSNQSMDVDRSASTSSIDARKKLCGRGRDELEY